MRVLLVGNYPADEQYSLLGFRNVLLKELAARGIETRLVHPEPRAIHAKSFLPGSRKWLGYIDKLALFPKTLKRAMDWADVVHLCEHSSAVYTQYLQRVPHLVTCHDMMGIRAALGEMPEWKVGKTGQIYQQMILKGLRRSQHIACSSETTRLDLARIGRLTEERMTVLYLGLFYPFRPMADQESAALTAELGLALNTPFLAHIGQNSPTKNRIGLLKIYRALCQNPDVPLMPLLMMGKPFTEELRRYIAENNLQENVRELVGLNNEQIRALYSRATALIFPSLYEGFGLPVIEAQSCGCPVFTSNRAPMTEVGGAAAIYFDPEQPTQAADIIADNLGRAEAMKSAGFENVKRFTTERMIEGYLQTYTRILSGK